MQTDFLKFGLDQPSQNTEKIYFKVKDVIAHAQSVMQRGLF